MLGKAAEEELAAHIRSLSSVGFPCSRKDVRNLAFQYIYIYISLFIKNDSNKTNRKEQTNKKQKK